MIDSLRLVGSCVAKANRALGDVTQIKTLAKSTAAIKDEVVLSLANGKVTKALGQKPTISYKEEKILQDSLSGITKLAGSAFKRVRYTFIPTVFPSGKNVHLRKSVLNEIIDNCSKGKGTKFSYVKKNGEEISGVVSKKLKLQNEDCYCSKVKIKSKEGIEEVAAAHYPKSNEIRVLTTDKKGQKKYSSIQGGDFPGKTNPLNNIGNAMLNGEDFDLNAKTVSLDKLG